MKTNELKNGTRVLLSYGDFEGDIARCDNLQIAIMRKKLGKYNPWTAVINDNKRGNIRFCNVFGWETELGSVYSHDIIAYEAKVEDDDGAERYVCDNQRNSVWRPVEHTPSQIRLRVKVRDIEKTMSPY